LRFRGKLSDLSADDRKNLVDRSSVADKEVAGITAAIIERVRDEGDDALFALARELDGVEMYSLAVPRDVIRSAFDSFDPSMREVMQRAAQNIERVHREWLPKEQQLEVQPGVIVGRRPDPLNRVGIYAPGGRAAYPSSVLMGAIPARVAGVSEIVLCSPPGKNGLPSNSVLVAAEIAGIDKVFAIGGAGAIAAMAVGTKTIPRVDKIVGPGNAFVAEAKIQLASVVAFDSPAGPSELVVIADDSADPQVIARELLAQAEHDPRAIVLAIAIGNTVADKIERELATMLESATRREIIAESLATRGGVVSVANVSEAVAAANGFAPEHLMIATKNPGSIVSSIRNAGTVFLGETSSVAFGDYLTGANHVLPTGGLARSYSGLSTLDFFRWTTWQSVTRDGASALAMDTAAFAECEGLDAHADAARAWEAGT
jgi:histidinol dehydrogenase